MIGAGVSLSDHHIAADDATRCGFRPIAESLRSWNSGRSMSGGRPPALRERQEKRLSGAWLFPWGCAALFLSIVATAAVMLVLPP